jgi:hypothetical protein
LTPGNEIHIECAGAVLRVALTLRVATGLSRVAVKQRAALDRWIGIIASHGLTNIPKERWRFEERFRVGLRATPVGVFALKEWQTRLYGGQVQGMQPPTLLFTEIDGAKKKDKADRAALERAAALLYEHFVGE